MNADHGHSEVPPPPKPAAGPVIGALLLPTFMLFVGAVLLLAPAVSPGIRLIGALLLVGYVVIRFAQRARGVARLAAPATRGPYMLAPNLQTWHQFGYSPAQHPSGVVGVTVSGGLLDLVGGGQTAVAATIVRSALVSITPRLVRVGQEQWWGIAIQRVDKPDDLEFGINDDQQDVAAAERRAIEVAAQLTKAMRPTSIGAYEK